MSEISLNMAGVAKAGPFPTGKYAFTIDDVEIKDSKSTIGNKNLSVSLVCSDTVEGKEEYIGKKLFPDKTFSLVDHPTSKSFLRTFLEAFTKEEWAADDMSLRPKELIGLAAWAMVTERDGQNQINNWYPYEG